MCCGVCVAPQRTVCLALRHRSTSSNPPARRLTSHSVCRRRTKACVCCRHRRILPQREILDRCAHPWNWRGKRRHESCFTAASIERAAAAATSSAVAAHADWLHREERWNGRELQPAATVARIGARGASWLRAMRFTPARHASAAVRRQWRARQQQPESARGFVRTSLTVRRASAFPPPRAPAAAWSADACRPADSSCRSEAPSRIVWAPSCCRASYTGRLTPVARGLATAAGAGLLTDARG